MAQLYETIFIIRPSLSDEDVQKLQERIKTTVEKAGGTIERLENWGKKKLAYEVKREKKGLYVQLVYRGTGAVVADLERFCRLDDALLKFLTVKLDERRLHAGPSDPLARPAALGPSPSDEQRTFRALGASESVG